jgi:hypothetical protein
VRWPWRAGRPARTTDQLTPISFGYSDGRRTHTEQTVGGYHLFTNAGMVQRDPDLEPMVPDHIARGIAERNAETLAWSEKAFPTHNLDARRESFYPRTPPADLLADFLLDVAHKQEAMIARKRMSSDVWQTLLERLQGERKLVTMYGQAKAAADNHEDGVPITEALPGLVLALAIAARTHHRAPGYAAIAQHVDTIMEDHL